MLPAALPALQPRQPYTTGITYGQPSPGTPLNVTLDSDVNVTLPAPGIGVALNNFGNGGPVLLSANGATINVTNPRRRAQGALRRDPGEQRHYYGVGPN